MNDLVKAPLLGLIAAALTTGGALMSEGASVPRSLMLGAVAFPALGGLATFPDDAAKKARLFEMVDHALYRAKRAGRNRVQAAGPEDAAT